MMNFDGPEVLDEWVYIFGSQPTVEQMKFLIKCGKHIRGRCRSNAALINWLKRNFTTRKFSMVERIDKMTGGTYETIEVT